MTWSPETEELGRRYYVLYGVSQTLWSSVVALSLASATGASPTVMWLVASTLAVGSSVLWRRAWLAYRAAFRAETDATIEAAKREFEMLDRELGRQR